MLNLVWRNLLGMGVAIALTACGGGRADQAAAACQQAIAEKAKNKEISVDIAAAASSAKEDGDDKLQLKVPVTFDPGLPRESKETYDCTVRFAASGADVIALNLTQ